MKTVLVLSILLCAAFAAPQPEGEKTNEEKAPARFNFCPDSWLQHGSRCFRFISTPMSWYRAEGQWMWIDREGFYYTNWYSYSSSSSSLCSYLRTTCSGQWAVGMDPADLPPTLWLSNMLYGPCLSPHLL
ncbi:hypothetical protein ABVT39_022409 [Epinephelus coioides]